MFRVKVGVLFAVPVVLTLLLWAVVIPPGGFMTDEMARLVGFLLLGIALLSTILVFRSAVATPAPASSQRRTAAPANEFRRGFVSAKATLRKPRAPRPSEIIALRRHRIEPRLEASKPPPRPILVPQSINMMKRRLEIRAEQLWRRRAG